ncbi:LysE family translocator [Rhizobium sp. SSA_523]|uniref:LysE family translocator n=1 Tax=Rhizobium sp. SSA_523 TaxID=2952477 RepID=UPI002091E4E9|nr:LysE family translocator [Rhizobium sp. SSA_523]MCO5730419.1 LysE family translocator [Rhizobium sp. SSA_523]WKC25679.1 LysE family translocator [Rhizobium sp. SSA_523]
MDLHTLIAFAAAFFVFAASPGPDNMTILARTLHNGAASGLAYGLGTVTGILIFLFLAVLGLSAFASGMGAGMTVLRYAGAAYLIWMGVRMWSGPAVVPEARPMADAGDLKRGFLAGVVLNLGNPKMPLFYIALLPNIVGPDLSWHLAASLAAVILLVEVVVIGGHVLLAGRARGLLRDARSVRRLNRGCGATMIGAGVAVVATR